MQNFLYNTAWFIIFVLYSIFFIIVLYYYFYIKRIIIKIKNKIIKLESKNNSKIIFIVDKFWSKKYFNIINYHLSDRLIDINDSLQFQNILNNTITENINRIDICIQSNGGYIHDNDIIINNLLNYQGEINTYIPSYAYSAASLISLCGSNIYLNNTAVLGPTDPTVEIKNETISVNSLLQLKKNKEIKDIKDMTLLHIYDAEKLFNENLNILRKIFKRHQKNIKEKGKKKNFITNMLEIFGSGKWSHSSPFTKKYLTSKGLNIQNSPEMDKYSNILNDIYKLNYFF